MTTTYYFDSSSAAQAASKHTEIICFYDGTPLVSAPKNCINLPIDNFSDYFLKSFYPYPSQVSFDALTLSKEVQEQILTSISNTINDIKNARTTFIEELLLLEITQQSAVVILENLLSYINAHQLLETQLPKEIVQKLIHLALFIANEHITLQTPLQELCKIVQKSLESKKESMLFIHLSFALTLVQSQKMQQTIDHYVKQLALYENIVDYVQFFDLVEIVFEKERGNDLATMLASILLGDRFWNQSLSWQKCSLFKIFNILHHFYAKYFHYRAIFDLLYPVFTQALQRKDAEILFFLHTPLQFAWNSASQTQEDMTEFHTLVEKKLEHFIASKLQDRYQLKENLNKKDPDGKKVLAIVYDRLLSTHSVTEVLYTFLKTLSTQSTSPYTIILYNLDFMELGGGDEEAEARFRALNITYVNLHTQLVGEKSYDYDIVKKALRTRQRIIDDGVNILIGFNTRVEYNFLFTTKTAPLQVYWSHGNFSYQLDSIDRYISHFAPTSTNVHDYHFFHIYQDFTQTLDENSLTQITKFKADYPPQTRFIGTISRLVKLDNMEFLTLIKNLLDADENLVFLACGPGMQEGILQKITDLGINPKRFIFTGNINTVVYAHIIEVFLDTFPMFQGNSRSEYIHNTPCGIAFRAYIDQDKRYKRHLTIIDEILHAPHLHEILTHYQISFDTFHTALTYPLVTSQKGYETKVNQVLHNPNLHKEIALCNTIILQEVEKRVRQEQGMQEFIQALQGK